MGKLKLKTNRLKKKNTENVTVCLFVFKQKAFFEQTLLCSGF